MEILRRFGQEGTLDELGFGVMRDAFADVFFPATNTIMTRTRYLIFIPAICLTIERDQLSGSQAARRLKGLEDQLREVLVKTEGRDVIGSEAKEKLKRYPSRIYWSALRQLGIFQHAHWSQRYYHEHLGRFYAAKRPSKDDDGLPHLPGEEWQNWDRELENLILEGKAAVVRGGSFPTETDFALTRAEAQYLKGKYDLLAERAGESLLGYLVSKGLSKPFSYPWDIPCPSKLTQKVSHARLLSMLAKGATMQYWDMLLAAQKEVGIEVLDDQMVEPFSAWWSATRCYLEAWQPEQFFDLVQEMGAIRTGDRSFLAEWRAACLDAPTAEALLRAPSARSLIRRRERANRPQKARLFYRNYLGQWKLPYAPDDGMLCDPTHVPYLLYYRSRTGGTFVADIVAGLTGGN
jgi:hypothetical protein